MKVTQHTSPNPQALDKALSTEKVQNQKSETDKDKSVTANSAAASRSTNVNISEQAMLMKKAAELAHASPDIQSDKVAALKKRIQDGTYQVDSAAVADRLVDEHLLDLAKTPN